MHESGSVGTDLQLKQPPLVQCSHSPTSGPEFAARKQGSHYKRAKLGWPSVGCSCPFELRSSYFDGYRTGVRMQLRRSMINSRLPLATTMTKQKQKPSCKACYRRKVRCDGGTPCGSCSRARKPLVCEYSPDVGEGSSRGDLPKGAACLPCRQRKRRCDGGLPCSTCKETSQSNACQYRKKPLPHEQEASTASHGNMDPRGQDTASANTDMSSMVLFARNNVPRAPPQNTDYGGELFSLRSLFLNYCMQYYGLHLNLEKREAIARGDTSGALIHPIFIPLSQLMGQLIADLSVSERWAHLRGQTWREAQQRFHVLNLLNSSLDALDPLTSIQVHQILALYWGRRKDFRGFQEFLGTASNTALRHHATLGLDDSVILDDQATYFREGRLALAHLVFIQTTVRTFMSFEPTIPPVLLVKFHRLFAQQHNKLELNFVRAKGLLLLTESQQLVTQWKQCESGDIVIERWGEQCRNLANDIQTHLHVLNMAINKLPLAPKRHALLLKSSTIVSLSALAELHAVLAPFHAVARQKHRNIIGAIAGITRTLTPEDHEHFDCSLEVCWGIASREICEQSPTPQLSRHLQSAALPNFGPLQLPANLAHSALRGR
ncbi:hypothetical protein B0H16DRAFT_1612392 [Mycena metata]|uniref:Zn(2)-C6 fungal-type domain-containing protein n=1 Tax=Mycena metata TaxID=1033252 RepID=A0AAD7HBK4_9AGAR|nr:hypothetical protein B0H16DRAFT_1612392 [Mycena metata]